MNQPVPVDIMKMYIERRKSDYGTVQSYLQKCDFEGIEKIAHQLKGNGATFGYPEVSTIGKKLEIAAIEEDEGLTRDALKDFEHWLGHLH